MSTPGTASADDSGQRIVKGEEAMELNLYIGPVIALIAGILILIIPRLLNYIVAIYLIVTGLIGLFGRGI
jgi:hypothetical protein